MDLLGTNITLATEFLISTIFLPEILLFQVMKPGNNWII